MACLGIVLPCVLACVLACVLPLQVLSDPNRRRQYDLSGGDEEAKAADFTPMDMEGIGNMQ